MLACNTQVHILFACSTQVFFGLLYLYLELTFYEWNLTFSLTRHVFQYGRVATCWEG